MFTVHNWMVAYNPKRHPGEPDQHKSGQIEVGPWPDHRGWSDKYDFTDGCCMRDWKDANRTLQMFIVFNTVVVRDEIDPLAAHEQFLKIDEYRRRISPDSLGADGEGGFSVKIVHRDR